MHANEPEMAERWEAETPDKPLPESAPKDDDKKKKPNKLARWAKKGAD
jgi:hypothetical protein